VVCVRWLQCSWVCCISIAGCWCSYTASLQNHLISDEWRITHCESSDLVDIQPANKPAWVISFRQTELTVCIRAVCILATSNPFSLIRVNSKVGNCLRWFSATVLAQHFCFPVCLISCRPCVQASCTYLLYKWPHCLNLSLKINNLNYD